MYHRIRLRFCDNAPGLNPRERNNQGAVVAMRFIRGIGVNRFFRQAQTRDPPAQIRQNPVKTLAV